MAKEPYGEPPSGEAPKPYYEVVAKESSGEPSKRIQWRTQQKNPVENPAKESSGEPPKPKFKPAAKNLVENPLDQARTRGV